MNRSDEIKDLIGALVKAQEDFKPVFKETENPAFRSKYADLQTIIAATKKALGDKGIVVLQAVRCNVLEKTTEVETVLAHTSGQWMSDTLSLPATMREKMDAQSVGSSVTYGRRYGLQAMLNIAADVDDDGNAAADIGSKQAAQAVAAEKVAIAKKVSVTYSDDGLMFLWGPGAALQNVHNALKAAAGKPNLEGMWTIPSKDAMGIVECLGENGVEVIQAEFPRQKAAEAAPRPSPSSRVALPGEVDGVLADVSRLKTKNKQDFCAVIIKTPMGQEIKASVFDNPMLDLTTGDQVSLFALLEEYKGKPISAVLKVSGKYTNLVFVSRIGPNEFEQTEEGIVAVRQAKLL